MRFIQYSIAGFTSALIVAMTGQVSVAFTITPSQPGATANWKRASGYVTEDVFGRTVYGTTEVSTILWTEPLPLGGSQIFNTTLLNWSILSEQGFWGWDFKPAQQELMGSFEILNYVACAPQDPCGIEAPSPNNTPRYDGVGALININYHPAPTDPQPGQKRIHWIQIARANYGSGIPGIIPGTWFIDNRLSRDNPYYDTIGMADENSFEDRPYNPLPFATSIENFFEAELYLAEETTSSESDKREVTIYNGIKWGWKNTIDEFEIQKTFFDSLYSSRDTDSFQLSDLTPGAKFYAEINNDIPGNICNPNTYLSARYGSNTWRYDNDSSPVGDGFASALTGNVLSDGTINLTVGAYGDGGSHIRGKDGGKYELTVKVFKDENDFPYVMGASSGGGGVGIERSGTTQQNPIFPNAREGGWQVFRNVPSCRWYDPTTSYGFEFQALDDTLFTEILDFPALGDNQFTVSVGDTVVGSKSPGQSLDFVSLLGQSVSNFKITGIDSKGSTEETAFPIQLAFNDRIGSFKMRPFSETFLDKTDDGSFGPFSLGFNMPFFGQTYNSFYVNNNGNISFGKSLGAFSPQSLTTQNLAPMIASYWADVDTRGTGNVSVLTGIPNEVTVTWDKVGYYSQRTDKTATFGLVMRGSDYPIPEGEGNIGLFYKNVQWETTGSSSTPAAIGFGDGLSGVNPGEYLFPGSLQPGISQTVKDHFYWFNLPTSGNSSCTSGCVQTLSARSASRQRPILGSEETYQKPKSTPEPTSALGLLALGTWGIIRALLIRKS